MEGEEIAMGGERREPTTHPLRGEKEKPEPRQQRDEGKRLHHQHARVETKRLGIRNRTTNAVRSIGTWKRTEARFAHENKGTRNVLSNVEGR